MPHLMRAITSIRLLSTENVRSLPVTSKDKLFFFAGYEGLRSEIGNALAATVPETGPHIPADPAHSLADALSADIGKVPMSPVSL